MKTAPRVDTASISGALLAGLLRRLFEARGMFTTGAILGYVEVREELTDTEAVAVKRHAALTGWAEDGAAREAPGGQLSEAASKARGDVLGLLAMRRRAVHALTQRERAYLEEGDPAHDAAHPRLLLLVTESDAETGSNAVEYTLFQAGPRPWNGVRLGLPLTVMNLVASADRFESIADSVLRVGSVARQRDTHPSAMEAAAAVAVPAPVLAHCDAATRRAAAAFARVTAAQARERDLAAMILREAERVRALREELDRRPRKLAAQPTSGGPPIEPLPMVAAADAESTREEADGAAEVFERAVLASSASYGPTVSTVIAGAAVADADDTETVGSGTDTAAECHRDDSEWAGPATPGAADAPASPPAHQQDAAAAAVTSSASSSPAAAGASDAQPLLVAGVAAPMEARSMTDIFGPAEADLPSPPKRRDAADVESYF